MTMPLCVVRGGGDLGTGAVWRLWRAGYPIVVLELSHPLTVRRTVAVSTAVHTGSIEVEGMRASRTDSVGKALALARDGEVAVLVSDTLSDLPAGLVIDARMAKRNLDTTIDDADLVVALGPGFTAGHDCHAVVETLRGHHLGRVLWSGSAAMDTGTPGTIAGRSAERVVRAPQGGPVSWDVAIGDLVGAGQVMGSVGATEVTAPFDGVVRGLIAPETDVWAGLKIGDVDPRADRSYCFEISDKALAVGGGVLEAVTTWRAGRAPTQT